MTSKSSPSADTLPQDKKSPGRSDLRYSFLAKTEITDSAGKQIIAVTSNLSRYGCHVRTVTPFEPGTPIKLKITCDRATFQSEGDVVYAIPGDGMGIHFRGVPAAERVTLKKWLVHISAAELQQRLRKTREENPSTSQKLIVLSSIVVVAIGSAVFILAWLGLLR